MGEKTLKINKDLVVHENGKGTPYKAGETVTIKCDEHGNPLNHFWRQRLHDAIWDECVEVVEKKVKSRLQIFEDD